MAFSFPAYHEETWQYCRSQAEIVQAILRALKELRWQHETDAGADVLARIPANYASWGERVLINVNPDGRVKVRSECAWPFQCADWGKNRRNVRELLAELEFGLKLGR